MTWTLVNPSLDVGGWLARVGLWMNGSVVSLSDGPGYFGDCDFALHSCTSAVATVGVDVVRALVLVALSRP